MEADCVAAAQPLKWEVHSEKELEHVFQCNLGIALFQLNSAKGSDPPAVCISQENRVTAKVDARARSLVFVPSTRTILADQDKAAVKASGKRDHVYAHVSLQKSAESQWRLLAPDDEDDAVVPFWLIRAQSQDVADPNLQTFVLEVTSPVSLGIRDPDFKDACKLASMKMRIPYLSNPARIEKGQVLAVNLAPKKRKASEA